MSNPEQVALLPCPFCGADSVPAMAMNMQGTRYYRQCNNCNMQGPDGKTRDERDAAWNRRAARPVADTVGVDELVDRFAAALKEKLHAAERKYGYSDDWMKDDWREELAAKLLHHVQKGDPRDVAAYCAFAWHHGWSVTFPGGSRLQAWIDAQIDLAAGNGHTISDEAVQALVGIVQEIAAAHPQGGSK